MIWKREHTLSERQAALWLETESTKEERTGNGAESLRYGPDLLCKVTVADTVPDLSGGLTE